MKRLGRIAMMRGAVIGIVWALLVAPAAAESPLLFGMLNQQSPALTAERWNPILRHVTSATGVALVL